MLQLIKNIDDQIATLLRQVEDLNKAKEIILSNLNPQQHEPARQPDPPAHTLERQPTFHPLPQSTDPVSAPIREGVKGVEGRGGTEITTFIKHRRAPDKDGSDGEGNGTDVLGES